MQLLLLAGYKEQASNLFVHDLKDIIAIINELSRG